MSQNSTILSEKVISDLTSGVDKIPFYVDLPTMVVNKKAGIFRDWQDTLNILRSDMSTDLSFSV